jgi:beta-xylosidase
MLHYSFLAFCCWLAVPQSIFAKQTGKWGDQGNGTFRNPVIAADFSDPDPVRVGDSYYLVSSTFESPPGITVLHSRDLVNWEIIGGVFTNLEKISDEMQRISGPFCCLF